MLGRQAAGQRRRGEERHAAHEQPAPSAEVAEAAHRDEQDRERQHVGVHHPLDAAEAGVEGGQDVRDGDVHDGAVEQDHEEAQAEHGEHGPGAAGLAGRAVGASAKVTDRCVSRASFQLLACKVAQERDEGLGVDARVAGPKRALDRVGASPTAPA